MTEQGLDAMLGMLRQEPNGSSTAIHLGVHQEDLAAKLRGRVALSVGDGPIDGLGRTIPLEMTKPIVVRSA